MRAWAVLPGLVLGLWAPIGVAAVGSPDLPRLKQVLLEESTRLNEINFYVEALEKRSAAFTQGLPDGEAGRCISDCVAFKVEGVEVDGETWYEPVPLSASEVAVLAKLNPAPSFLNAYAQSALATQGVFNQSVRSAGGGGMIAELLGGISTGPGTIEEGNTNSQIMSPFSLMFGAGWFASQVSEDMKDAQRSLASSGERAQANMDQKLALASQLREEGPEIVEGVEGIRYVTSAINQPLPNSGGPEAVEGELNRAYLVFDPERQLLLKQRTEGTVTRDGQTQEFFIEVVNSDFRNPPGCGDLIRPFRRITRIGGIMTDEELAQMEQARAQLAEFEQQLASMPPQQRQMMESMMGGQMDAVRSLASGGAMETSQEIEEIYCNPDLALLFGSGMGENTAATYDLATIQEYLLILGYEPGNTEGELDTLTEIAISAFQAERGMAVTGQPSLALQQALAAEMG